jgi:hypothetical protein
MLRASNMGPKYQPIVHTGHGIMWISTVTTEAITATPTGTIPCPPNTVQNANWKIYTRYIYSSMKREKDNKPDDTKNKNKLTQKQLQVIINNKNRDKLKQNERIRSGQTTATAIVSINS